jgi:hypothetical protein
MGARVLPLRKWVERASQRDARRQETSAAELDIA